MTEATEITQVDELAELKSELALAQAVQRELTQLKSRISHIACKHAKGYPSIATVDPMEQLYAIGTTLEGTDLAIGDWEKMVNYFGERLFGDTWCPAVLLQEWRNIVKIGE